MGKVADTYRRFVQHDEGQLSGLPRPPQGVF